MVPLEEKFGFGPARYFRLKRSGAVVGLISTMLVSEFVEKIYLGEYVEKNLRAATKKQYRDVWENHLKARMGKLTLRDFRTVHGERMLAQIAAQAKLGRSSLRHCKAFLSGAFKQAKRLGILDGVNPMMDVSIPRVPEAAEDTYAYSLSEIKAMLAMLEEPARTVVLTAALTGLRKSELRGLTWDSFDGKELTVTRSVWNSTVSEPKTRRSRSPIPVVRQLSDALEAHRLRMGVLAQPGLPIFQAGNGKPLESGQPRPPRYRSHCEMARMARLPPRPRHEPSCSGSRR